MDFAFDKSLVEGYKSESQRIRVMSETWVGKNIFCPVCGNPHICNLGNNMPVADLACDNCGEIFELKSKQGTIGNKIVDGAYTTMIERINSLTNPDLFILNYSKNYQVTNLLIVPKYFFVETIIEKRKPLSMTARRAGWTGCNILVSNIPIQGRIQIVQNQKVADAEEITRIYSRAKQLQTNSIEKRGWILDVLECVNSIDGKYFNLSDMYDFVDELKEKHSANNNIEAKIRQQLQLLRDKGFLEFLGRGRYKKIL